MEQQNGEVGREFKTIKNGFLQLQLKVVKQKKTHSKLLKILQVEKLHGKN